jgi:hypothetical protein
VEGVAGNVVIERAAVDAAGGIPVVEELDARDVLVAIGVAGGDGAPLSFCDEIA